MTIHHRTVHHRPIWNRDQHRTIGGRPIPTADHHRTIHHRSIEAADNHGAVTASIAATDNHWTVCASRCVHIAHPSTGVSGQIGRTKRVQRASSRISASRNAGITPTAIGWEATDITRSPIPFGATISGSSSGVWSVRGRIIAAAADARNRQSQH
jgi:hypothetical protein